ncbi:sodium:proton antiporter [Polymorphobacter sp. PAMC 29334]|uniref:cation:proton antiporter n=1 Tax=Polymorphobacter sp. PAMC 29334 TaxID=2862331 RepID=UPI001D020C57|nr:sodium:proton antiporter [Polymorphobacter sp. PAMC 29334]
MSITPFDAAAILIVLAALLGYINQRFIGLPPSVGLTVMGAVASLGVIGLDLLLPDVTVNADIVRFLRAIDFHATLMDGMLSFLLFAGALHVDWTAMKRGRLGVVTLSTVGVLMSTAIVAGGFLLITAAIGLPVPLVWCLVFGALISPTDPVAVMAVLKRTSVPPTLQATVAGESLYNDGVGVVLFSIILGTALGSQAFEPGRAVLLFAREAGGGLAMGLVLGWLAFVAMRSIDDYNVEVMISLAVVMGGYTLGRWLHISGPVAMATAGLLIGNHVVDKAMSDKTSEYLLKFWSIIDEILNAVLFLLIGLEVVAIPADPRLLLAGVAAIPLVMIARAVSVLVPLNALRPWLNLGPLAPTTLIWGGLRGGISVALALSLPEGPARSTALAATYIIVLFSVIVQGGSIERVLRWKSSRADGADD